jgi:VIT1/CCC1 family predicted Fe2+/Mn2+ transporter
MRIMARHTEIHKTQRIGWLRAAVLGANDGIVSTASLLVGVAAAGGFDTLMVTGIAAMVAGAMSMAAGEYVSVYSQADTEQADMAREAAELLANPQAEQRELSGIYEKRGLTPQLAQQVAEQFMAHDALAAHARDELGLSPELSARPLQAALASAASFAVGAALPLIVVAVSPPQYVIAGLSVTAIAFLALLGGVAARAGGAKLWPSVLRVTFWGALAMAVTAGVGAWFGATV